MIFVYPPKVLAALASQSGDRLSVAGMFLVPIGWRYALLVWGYALAWFILNDFVKIWVYKFLRRDRNMA